MQSIFKQILKVKLKEESGSAVSKYTGKVRLTFLDKVYIICVPDLKHFSLQKPISFKYSF